MTPNLLSPSHRYCAHTLFYFLDQMTASPSCLWPSEHLFGLLMNIFMCLPGRAAQECVRCGVSGFLYRTSLLVVAGVAHWSFGPLTECCRALLAPELKATTSKTNQMLPPPHLCQLENDRPGHCAQRPFTINSN